MPDLVTDGDNLGDHLATRSFKTIKGTDIASATNITIGTSGNTFDVTGTTTIQHFDNANWVVGSVISLHFDGAVTLTNNAGGLSGNQANILLSGDANFTTATGDILTFLLHDSTNWQEISRNSVASIPDDSITNAKLATGIDAVKLADGSVTNSELKYINTLSDNAQTQLDLKAPLASPTFTGTVVLPNVPAIVTTQLDLKATLGANTFTGNQSQGDGIVSIYGAGSDLKIQHISGNNQIEGITGNMLFYTPASTSHIFNVNNVTQLDIDGDGIKIPSLGKIYLDGGSNTYITETSPDVVDVVVGGTSRLNLSTDWLTLFNIIPTLDDTYDIGTASKQFRNLHVGEIIGLSSTLNLGGNNLDNIKNLHHNISTSAGTGMDFSTDQLQTLSRSTTTTFNGSNYAAGRSKTLKLLSTSGSTITLGFDSSWKFIGAKPTDLAGSKTAILTLTCFGSTASDVVAGYAVEE